MARERVLSSKVDGHNVVKQFRRRLYARVLAEAPRLFYAREKGDVGEERKEVAVWTAEVWQGKQPAEGLPEEFEGIEA